VVLRRVGASAVVGVGLWVAAATGVDLVGSRSSPEGTWDAIVVPGAKVYADGGLSAPMRDRTLRAVELWRAGVAPRIVISGGLCSYAGATQAEAGAALAEQRGVPRESLVLEKRAFNTEENARFTAELLGPVRVVVVTDTYHVLRCELVFGRFFAEVEGVGVAPPPTVRAKMALREVLALTSYLARGRLGLPGPRPEGVTPSATSG